MVVFPFTPPGPSLGFRRGWRPLTQGVGRLPDPPPRLAAVSPPLSPRWPVFASLVCSCWGRRGGGGALGNPTGNFRLRGFLPWHRARRARPLHSHRLGADPSGSPAAAGRTGSSRAATHQTGRPSRLGRGLRPRREPPAQPPLGPRRWWPLSRLWPPSWLSLHVRGSGPGALLSSVLSSSLEQGALVP